MWHPKERNSVTPRILVPQEQVDIVANGFNEAAWRRQSGSDLRPISSVEDVSRFVPRLCGSQEACKVSGLMYVGFPLESGKEWQIRVHGAFTTPTTRRASSAQNRELPPRSADPPLTGRSSIRG